MRFITIIIKDDEGALMSEVYFEIAADPSALELQMVLTGLTDVVLGCLGEEDQNDTT